ncbi:MAG: hypothetical protein PHP43_04810 [Methanoculleus sp.]|nr:hypothetical protein [Methanoculleus sp.]
MLQAVSGGGEPVAGEHPRHRQAFTSSTLTAWTRGRPGSETAGRRAKEKGGDIVYSPVPSELGDEGRAKSRTPGAPETPTPRAEHEISKKGEERIARQQVEDGE